MSGVPVPIASVRVDPAYTSVAGRTRYRVTLACGCFWWEDRDSSAPLPAMNTRVLCYATHAQRRTASATHSRPGTGDMAHP
jgi:hypothetical protein